MAIKPVEILITAKDKASSVFGSIRGVAVAAGAAIAAAFAARFFAGAVTGAADLEAQLSQVQAVSGATKDEMVLLRKAAEDAGASTKFTATESAQALGNLARAGLDVRQSIAALPATLALASAGQIGLDESSSIVTKTLAGFGLQAESAGRIADVLALGANASNTSVTGLGQALSYTAPTAVALGLSLESTVAILGKFADGGIDASRAGTALNGILAQFADPASQFRKELASAGITTNNFEEALVQLAGAGDGGRKAIRAVGLEAGPALQSLVNQGVPALQALTAKLNEAGGSAAATAATMEDNLVGASRGLASAWDTVKNALGTPVLPVLKQGVTDLADSLRAAVSDGTIGRFGSAIAKGFESALTWARAFLAEVDFGAMANQAASAADQVGAAFERLSTYAKNTGNAVQLVWGVMTAGSNAVLSVVYTVGEAFAGVASNVQSGVALILDGLSKITFGSVSASFKAAADDMRLSAEATWAASQALATKGREAFISMADGAELARGGWAGLTGEMEVSQRAAAASASAMAEVVKQLQATADTNAAARKATEEKTAADEKARLATLALIVEVNAYRREYEAALAAGDPQLAVGKLQQIQKALRATGDEAKQTAKEAEKAAKAITDAFTNAGIKTKTELANAATQARADFTTIKNSGQATADGVQQAFKRMADSAIASGDAGATAFVKSQAAAQGFEITVDKAGKLIVTRMNEAANATGNAGKAADSAAGSYGRMGQSAELAAASIAKLAQVNAKYARPGEGSQQQGQEKDYDPGRGSIYGRPGEAPKNGDGLTQAEWQRKEKLKGQGAQDLSLQFNLRDKLNKNQLTEEDVPVLKNVVAALKANQKTFDSISPGLNSLQALQSDREWANTAARFQQFITETERGARSPATAQQAPAPQQQAVAPAPRTVQVNINTGRGNETVNTDDAGAQAIIRALQQAGLAAGR